MAFCTAFKVQSRSLYGGDQPWNAADWVASDDRVRGGKSESHLTVKNGGSGVVFSGNLDIKTLGGAGFASQHTTGDLNLDLSAYDGLELVVGPNDGKMWTLNLKDSLLPTSDNGREQASTTWEYSFNVDKLVDNADGGLIVTIPWSHFTPTYRGREQRNVKPLNLKDIKRLGFMVRSFFGSQEGNFNLSVHEVRAYKEVDEASTGRYRDDAPLCRFRQEPPWRFRQELLSERCAAPTYEYRDKPSYSPSSEDDAEITNEKAAWMEPSKSRSFFCCF